MIPLKCIQLWFLDFFLNQLFSVFTRKPYITCWVVIYRLYIQIYVLLICPFLKWKREVFLSGSAYGQAKVLFGFRVRMHCQKSGMMVTMILYCIFFYWKRYSAFSCYFAYNCLKEKYTVPITKIDNRYLSQ